MSFLHLRVFVTTTRNTHMEIKCRHKRFLLITKHIIFGTLVSCNVVLKKKSCSVWYEVEWVCSLRLKLKNFTLMFLYKLNITSECTSPSYKALWLSIWLFKKKTIIQYLLYINVYKTKEV